MILQVSWIFLRFQPHIDSLRKIIWCPFSIYAISSSNDFLSMGTICSVFSPDGKATPPSPLDDASDTQKSTEGRRRKAIGTVMSTWSRVFLPSYFWMWLRSNQELVFLKSMTEGIDEWPDEFGITFCPCLASHFSELSEMVSSVPPRGKVESRLVEWFVSLCVD